jgi:hypothetical protein
MKNICLILIVIIIAANKASAQNVILSTSVEAADFLWYNQYANKFDRSATQYEFGELTLLYGGGEQWINLKKKLPEYKCEQAGAATGISADLLQYGESQSFTIPADASLRFFRRIENIGYCNNNDPSVPNDTNCTFAVKPIDIQDRTEFVVQLVRRNDNAVLFTLDSVGVMPTTSLCIQNRYGTSPEKSFVTVPLPQFLAGAEAYVRIVPARWGDTPAGISLFQYSQTFSQAALYNGNGERNFSPELYDSLENLRFQQLLKALDTAKTGSIFLRRFHDVVQSFSKREYWDTIESRYGDKIHWQPTYYDKSGTLRQISKVQMKAENKSDGNVVIQIDADKPYPLMKLVLHNSHGDKLATPWQGILFKGRQSVEVNTEMLMTGSYVATLSYNDGEAMRSVIFTVVK